MPDYRVNLDVFAGPLDLLLYLVRRDEIDIYDIPIAHITEQYVKYIEMLKQLDIELAGDFLVMAATLMQIKSRLLLPPEERGEEEEEEDPRWELVRQLLEYKRFKEAADQFHRIEIKQEGIFPRPGGKADLVEPSELPLGDIHLFELFDAFSGFGGDDDGIGKGFVVLG